MKFLFPFVVFIAIVVMYFLIFWEKKESPIEKKQKPESSIDKVFRRMIGSAILLFAFLCTMRFVKMVPIHLKVGILMLDIVVLYIVITYIFKINKK